MNNEETEISSQDEDYYTDTEPELNEIAKRSESKIKKATTKLKQCEEEKKKLLEELQRIKADFLNARKRMEEEKHSTKVKVENAHILQLLPLCDSFQMAFSNKEAWEAIDQSWREGVEGIYNQLQSILGQYNVTVIDKCNVEFDPHIHEAVANETVDTKDLHHKVIDIVQNGYQRKTEMGVDVLRPARVTVGEFRKH